jgi:class 3 adenylate cyclase/tRNA A-37 threonylcarbamoyl transferase component Bud32
MRFLLLSFLRLLHTIVEFIFWAMILALLIRLAITLNPSAGMNNGALLVALRRNLDPVLTSLGTAVGLRWPAESGLAPYFPLALATVVFAIKVVLGRGLGLWRFRVLEPAEPKRAPKRRSSQGETDLVSDSRQSRDELLKQYREIEKKLQSARKTNCAFLNVDVVGSTRMKTGETPTAIAASFQAYEELLRRIFQQNKAWKQSWTPDGVLICFQSRELAVRAAQQLLAALQQFNSGENRLRMPFRVRCGVSEGEVAIFEDTNLSTFSDPVIDTAAHLQKDARPNALCLAEGVLNALGDRGAFYPTGRVVDGRNVFEWSLEPRPEGADASLTTPPTPSPLTPSLSPVPPPLPPAAPAAGLPQPSFERTIASNPEATGQVRTIGRYEIVEELGRGAMGAVYKAIDPQIGRTVALKVILTRGLTSEEMRTLKERFYREARAAGKLTHPGIVTIYDVAEDSYGSPYLVMEFVEGTSLDKALAPGGTAQSFPFSERLSLAIEIAAALDYAHRNGVIHRDIKPSNILMTRDGHSKIADFGIAKLVGSQATIGGQVLGTPAFVSPEQLTGSPADGRSDIFSLGVMLYWIFTGERPFHGETMTTISYKVVHTMPPPARELNRALPEELDQILFRCLAKNPADRYQAASELTAELESLRDTISRRARPSA